MFRQGMVAPASWRRDTALRRMVLTPTTIGADNRRKGAPHAHTEHNQVGRYRPAGPAALRGSDLLLEPRDPQPDPNTHYEAFSRYVTTNGYVLKHLFLTILGTILGIFGSIALGAYLTRSRAGRLGLWAMVITVLSYCLFLTWGGVSTFAAPQEGQAYLAGVEEYHELPIILANTLQVATVVASVLLGFVGNVLLGV